MFIAVKQQGRLPYVLGMRYGELEYGSSRLLYNEIDKMKMYLARDIRADRDEKRL